MKPVHVAAAVIRGQDGRILLAKRPLEKHQGGLWEFPGGKVEAGETVEAALKRELLEEIGIEITACEPLIQVPYHYPDKFVLLDVWEVTGFTGVPTGREGQPLEWVAAKRLDEYEFPAANKPIVTAARLAKTYLITPDVSDRELLNGVYQALNNGAQMICLRAPDRYEPEYRDLAQDVLGLCAGKAQVMLKGPREWLGDFPAAGWHLTSEQLRKWATKGRPFPSERLLAASCHNAEELALAEQMGVDFVTLSPVQKTLSHPEATPLGWELAHELIRACTLPVYLLGGLDPMDLPKARKVGAQGIAGISGLWPLIE